ncbi:hypothetical protein M316_0028 [Nitrincola phage 1M3-16]|uniref:hypothetical protein n=1 Tax=Nitrincola phage 1M3-16 TaxID=1472912 RepID=UPI000444BD3D|nr:hypothetical protein GJ22_gp124 [Nitrincola phage 1M3-16]AHX01093.1 hypothetical protein M316_0028 [Nitrincola phage 1M3-16]
MNINQKQHRFKYIYYETSKRITSSYVMATDFKEAFDKVYGEIGERLIRIEYEFKREGVDKDGMGL